MRSIKTYIVGAMLALLASSPAIAAPGPWVETKTPLVASATYTGPARYLDPLGAGPTNATFFGAHVFADQAGTAYIDISDDAATWNVAASATLTASTASDLTVPIRSAYYRVRVVNGGVDEATLRVFSSQTQSGPGGSAGAGTSDATAANQTSQITQETKTATALGAPADSACGTDAGTCGVIAQVKRLLGQFATLLTGQTTGNASAATTATNTGTTATNTGTIATNTANAATSAAAAAAALGTTADTVCSTATGTCTIPALLKFLNAAASTTTSHYSGAVTNTAVAVDASAGTLYGYHISNPNAATCFLQFFNTAQGSVTVGTTAPVLSLEFQANYAANLSLANGDAFSTAITIAATTTRTGGTACSSSMNVNIWYK